VGDGRNATCTAMYLVTERNPQCSPDDYEEVAATTRRLLEGMGQWARPYFRGDATVHVPIFRGDTTVRVPISFFFHCRLIRVLASARSTSAAALTDRAIAPRFVLRPTTM
jgi:hypothetical protein